MPTDELINILEKGIETGRISPYLASYIAASELQTWPDETDFDEVRQGTDASDK